MEKLPRPQLDRLRPAERTIYQKLRPQIGRADVDQMAAHLRKAHPHWSEFYNVDAERIIEVLEHAGLGELVRRAPSPPPAPAPASSPGEPAAIAAPDSPRVVPRQRGRKATGATSVPPATEPEAVLGQDAETALQTARPGRAVERPARTSQPAEPADEADRLVARAPAPGGPAEAPEQPVLLSAGPPIRPVEPVPIRALRSDRGAGRQADGSGSGSIRSVARRTQVEHVADPLIPAADAAEPAETTGDLPAPDRRRGRPASTARALKRAAGSLDELLQQLDTVDVEVNRARAEIEQVNRRIAELERRRQALGDQLALTLRSRVPAEILRLAAEAAKSPAGDHGSSSATTDQAG
ncbi:MAG TPA: hypothetical protein VHL09_07920 [Dehalococcoidia bacterium]|nr:hypothetical protein [Dehalococcoidia bacterium]